MQFIVQAGGTLQGNIRVPGDKSISHRAIMLGALAEGITEINGFLDGDDCLATLNAFRQMGVRIDELEKNKLRVYGVGLHGLKQPKDDLMMGNSGTSMRLMAGLMSGQAFDVCMTGDRSLSGRPMRRVTVPLAKMGAMIETDEGGTPPLTIRGGQNLQAINYDLPIASAQVKSSVLLAGLYANGKTCVTEPAPTRDHSERMLRGFAYDVHTDGSQMCLKGRGRLKACHIDVPADISSAAFFMVAASIAPNSDLTLRHVGVNPTRTGVLDILRLMGANIRLFNQKTIGGEPVADIQIRSTLLKGIKIPEALVPLAIDEFPVLFIAAAFAQGKTILTGAEELRVKESDRIQVMADGLRLCGVKAEPMPDGIVIQGGDFNGGQIESHDDHRIAMAFSVAALCAKKTMVINHCSTVDTSFPGFVKLARSVGFKIKAITKNKDISS